MFCCLELQELQRLNRVHNLKIIIPGWVLFVEVQDLEKSKKWIRRELYLAYLKIGMYQN